MWGRNSGGVFFGGRSYNAGMSKVKLILASRSPRRAKLLRDAGYTFEQVDPPFEDPPQPPQSSSAIDLAMELAASKGASAKECLANDDRAVILAADTICVGVGGQLIGQPADRENARAMINGFVNEPHDVVSGVALIPIGFGGTAVESFADVATVRFGHLSDNQIEEYLDSGQWQGKAGGYNLFDRQSDGWPVTVDAECDPGTVVGLPMRKLVPALDRWSINAVTESSSTTP